MTGIPVFQEIRDLHHASLTLQVPVLEDFHIYRNEDADRTCRLEMGAHRNNFFQISIDTHSAYELKVNAQSIRTAPGKIYFVGQGKLTSWNSPDTRQWEGISLMFKPGFLSAGSHNTSFLADFPFLRSDSAVSLDLPESDKRFLTDIGEKALQEQMRPQPDESIIRHYLCIMLIHLRRMYAAQPGPVAPARSRETEIVSAFEDLVEKHFLEFRSISTYADRLCISPKYLSALTRKVCGKNAKVLVMDRVLAEARALLKQTSLSVSQIASQLQFEDASNFAKFFTKLSGEPPTAYRNKG